MAISLVTLDFVKSVLAVDFDDDDTFLEALIETASAAVLKYLKIDEDDVTPVTGGGFDETQVPIQAKTATAMLVGYYYRNRDHDPDGDFERGYLPKPVTAILYPLRDPTLA